MYKAGAVREPSPTSGTAAAHPNDTGPAAAEEAAGETVHPAATGAPVYAGPAQATCSQDGNSFSSIRRLHP